MGSPSPASPPPPPPPPCSAAPAPPGLRSHRSSRPKARIQNISELILDVPSRGCKNHLKGSCQPCSYSVQGTLCPHGANCNNCHHYHDSETIRIWRLLSKMTKEERIAFDKECPEQPHKAELKNPINNSGSKNHHKERCRPCFYSAEGTLCPHGANCNHCHHYHDSETIRIRRLLSKMTKAERIALDKDRQEQPLKAELKNQNNNKNKTKTLHPPAKEQQQELELGKPLCRKDAMSGDWNTEECRSVFTAASCQLADTLAEVLQVSRGFTEAGVPQWSMYPSIHRL